MDKNKLMLIIIIVLLVLLLGAIGFVAYKAVTITSGDNQAEEEVMSGEVVVLKPEEFLYVDLDQPISTNLRTGADGLEHVIRVSITFGLDNRDPENEEYMTFLETFNSSKLLVRSICLDILTSKTYEDVTAPDAKTMLADEILVALQDAFQTNYINSVFITDMWRD